MIDIDFHVTKLLISNELKKKLSNFFSKISGLLKIQPELVLNLFLSLNKLNGVRTTDAFSSVLFFVILLVLVF